MKLFADPRFYDRIAPAYAIAQRSIPLWRGYIRQVLPWLAKGHRVLEIGAGPGMLLGMLARRRHQVVGLDVSWAMLRQARRRLRRFRLPVCLVRGDAVHLPYLDHTFDRVVMTFTLSAIPDAQQTLCEIARVLCPGGILALVDAGFPPSGSRLGTALARLWIALGDSMWDEATLMRRAGLEVIAGRELGVFGSVHLVVGRKPTCEPRATTSWLAGKESWPDLLNGQGDTAR